MKKLIVATALVASFAANADGLKVFGPEFCDQYSAGSCINFHYKELKDAKTSTGSYKYPKGRKAYDDCVNASRQTDGELAY